MSRRAFWISFLVVTLLIAGVASSYASGHPDGLEYVAGGTGFLDAANESAASASPLADYGIRGVDDDRLSGGTAGIVGVLLVLALGAGLFKLLARRGGDGRTGPNASGQHAVADGRV